MSRTEISARCVPGLPQSLFDIRRGERVPVMVAALYFFCVLTALMVLRPARDALGMAHGIETVRWLILGTALVTLAINPLFGWLASRLRRMQLVGATYGFFVASLLGFWGLMTFAPGPIGDVSGQVFYVWFNVFNLFVTMVFWALLTERFTTDQGRRCFALISAGGTLGAIFGPWLASQLTGPLGTGSLLPVAGGFLLLGMLAAWWLLSGPTECRSGSAAAMPAASHAPERIGGTAWAGIRSVLGSPYLLGVAGYVMLMAVTVTIVYFTRLQMVAGMTDDIDARAAILGRIDMWTHIAVLALQLVLARQVLRRFGLGVSLVVLPVATAVGFVGLAIYGSFVVLVLLEAATRAVQRGITQPAREVLFTDVEREDKYKAKAFIDTFVYRSGDVVGAQIEGVLGRLGLAFGGLAAVVFPLALAWAALALWLGRPQAHQGRARGWKERSSTP